MKLYIDWISQPSKAVKSVLDILKVEYQLCPLKIQFNETKTPQYTTINPLQQVPTLIDGDFILRESHAIMKYVIQSKELNTQLYPISDNKTLAKIDEYLDFHHTNTRRCFHYYYQTLIAPKKNEIVYPELLEKDKQIVNKTFNYIDQQLLKNQDYLCGNQLTIADISACCEIFIVDWIKYDFTVYPNMNKWLYKVFNVPEIRAAHDISLKITQKQNPKSLFLIK